MSGCSAGTSDRNDPRWDKDRDCAGICFGSAALDQCGVCAGGSTGRVADADLGCDNQCFSGVKQCGMLYWGPVVITSSGALCGLLVIICIMVLRSRLRQRRQEIEIRMRATRVTNAVRMSRAQIFRQRTQSVLESLPELEYNEKDTSMNFSNTTVCPCLPLPTPTDTLLRHATCQSARAAE